MNSVAGCRLVGTLAVLAALAAGNASGRQHAAAKPGPGAGCASGQAAGHVAGSAPLRIVSLNMQGRLDAGTALRELGASDALRRADIFLLQEIHGEPRRSRDFVDRLSRSLGLPFVHVPDDARLAIKGSGLAVISRFALKETSVVSLKYFNLVYRSRERIALAQTVETPLGDMRLFNLHLDSRVNSEQRLHQLSRVLDAVEKETRPVIIGGDFNTGDFYWVGHVLPIPRKRNQRDALLRRMSEGGYQTPFESTGPTHDRLGLQLDWIFFRHVRALTAGTQKIDFSDHHAIWADILLP